MINKCSSCKYWNKTQYFQEGECRKHAPINLGIECHPQNNIINTRWPVTTESDWCDDHEFKHNINQDKL